MKVTGIAIKNILGIEELELQPGQLTVISGPNGAGKTSVLEAIRAAIGGGTDATLVRQGAETGEVVLLLDDETTIHRRYKPSGASTLTVRRPDVGAITAGATWLRKLADAWSLNPVDFLTADPKTREKLLLEAQPIELDPAAVREALGYDRKEIPEGHGLRVLAQLEREHFDQRTEVARSLKERAATITQLKAALPKAPEGEGTKSSVEELATALEKVKYDRAEATREADELHAGGRAKIDRALLDAELAAGRQRDTLIASLKNEAERKIEAIRAALTADVEQAHQQAAKLEEQARADANEQIKQIEEAHAQRRGELVTLYQPQEDELLKSLTVARERAQQHERAEGQRQLLATMEKQAEGLDAKVKTLAKSIEGLRALRGRLLEALPIAGVEIRDGQIYVEGIVYDRLPESRKVRLAVEIAKLRAGDLPLVCVDGLERLDSANWKLFAEAAAAADVQLVVARVTDDEGLTVTTSKEVQHGA